MLFGIVYTLKGGSEADTKRSLQLFTSWEPTIEFKGHWALATGGGMAIAEAGSAEAMVEAIAPWGAFFDFRVEPAIEIESAVPILMKTNAWRDSIA